MKKTILASAVLACAAFTVQAAEFDTVEDTDGNGSYSLEEIQASYPDFSEEQFAEMDADGSGELSEDELDDAKD